MQRIYMHHGSKEFDPELLRKEQENNRQFGGKNSADLWASPFNERDSFTWEEFLACNSSTESFLKAKQREKMDTVRKEFIESLDWRGEDGFYQDSPEKQKLAIENYESKTDRPIFSSDLKEWKSQYEKEQSEIHKVLAGQCQEYRDESFFFIVDQDKILHINSIKDIEPYLQRKGGPQWDDNILYSKIKGDGYGGIELHNMPYLQMDNNDFTVFTTWQADSIAIWDPDIITPVSSEIAHISRIAAQAYHEFEQYLPMMDEENLTNWMDTRQEEVQAALDNDLFSMQDVGELYWACQDREAERIREYGEKEIELDPDWEYERAV